MTSVNFTIDGTEFSVDKDSAEGLEADITEAFRAGGGWVTVHALGDSEVRVLITGSTTAHWAVAPDRRVRVLSR